MNNEDRTFVLFLLLYKERHTIEEQYTNNIDDILKKAVKYGIIDIDNAQRQIEIMKKQQILAEHQYKIYQTKVVSNGRTYNRWITFVMVDGKRKQIKRKTKEELEDYLVQFYEGTAKSKIITFQKCYDEWYHFKQQLVADNTLYKYQTDYSRFFEGTDFIMKDISLITEKDIVNFLSDIVTTQQPLVSAFKMLCGNLREIFEYAVCNRVIKENPFTFLKPKLKLLNKKCKAYIPKSAEERTISPNDINLLLKRLQQDYDNSPQYITPYAIEFALLTGCRVGEIAALRWTDINNGIITISSSEKAHRGKGQKPTYTIETTKTGKERKIPVTKAMSALLKRIATAELAIGARTEFVFSNSQGRIKASRISDCMRKKCNQAGIAQKSIHACRRTVNSTLKDIGANTSVAASLLGHTCEVNNMCYTYDISGLDYKKELLEKANEMLIN